MVTNRTEAIMTTELLTYSQLGERLSCSPEAARALVKRLHLPRQKANNGKVLVSVDLSEINHKSMPARSPADHRPVTALLKASVEALQTGLAKLEASATCHRADFDRERERLDRLMVELLRAALDAQSAKEAVARLEGELSALRSRSWWRRMVGTLVQKLSAWKTKAPIGAHDRGQVDITHEGSDMGSPTRAIVA
jgi:glutamine synthetase adenylyltransferase